MMSGERTAIEREMFIAAVRETVFGFLIDPALTWRWIAGGMAFLRSSHKKGGKSHDSQGSLERGVVGQLANSCLSRRRSSRDCGTN